jgi:hypothetical protein
VKNYCFLITDKQHKVTYASKKSEQVFHQTVSHLLGKEWVQFVSEPTPDFIKTVIRKDAETAFYNGMLSFSDAFWFCDYGRRHNSAGAHIGFELIISPANSNAVDYIKNFYQSIKGKSELDPKKDPVDLFYEEIEQLSETTGTDFLEVLTALQNGEA